MIRALPETSYKVFNHQFDTFEEAIKMIAKSLDVLTEQNLIKLSWKLGRTPQEIEDAWNKAKAE